MEQIESLRELATKVTSTLKSVNIMSSKQQQSMAHAIDKIVDLELQIDKDIDKLLNTKKDIVSTINQVENPEYQMLLELRYLCFKKWEQIAVDMNYELRYLQKLHHKSLDICEKIKSKNSKKSM